MRKVLFFIIMMTVTTVMAESLLVGSFNLRCPGDKAPNDWENRAPRLYRDLERIGFEVFGTQETVPEYVKDICGKLGYKAVGHGRNADKSGESVAVFYDPRRLEVISEETFWLSETPETCSMSWGSTLPRIATIGVFRDKKSGRAFIFANVHLQHKRMYETQKKQLNVVFERLKAKYDSSLPVVLTGDFNSAPSCSAPRLAAEHLRDARLVSAAPATGPQNETYHGYQADPAKRTHKERIDYIFVSPGITVQEFATVDNFNKNGLASSDHYPISARVLIKQD